jgi:hypothetical protein
MLHDSRFRSLRQCVPLRCTSDPPAKHRGDTRQSTADSPGSAGRTTACGGMLIADRKLIAIRLNADRRTIDYLPS